ncbi:hypothetical protein M2158_004058 [Streptomyces sp. SAI-144]|uniref:hypothetical protein n=1 Tax=Streptomyces sp. SAI-144 TaxID=2940544 RepID=UPI0024772B3C|nr:hypothetical protein [Streptomyces sp. SAI-144]MDH6435581.1 hypothetical protein [Streptomyces sp. SAI-144]
MSVNTHTCLTIECDVCGQDYEPDEYTLHFRDLAEARDVASRSGWTVTADRQVICALGDVDHQAAIDALMPPEPITQCTGQLGLDGSAEG